MKLTNLEDRLDMSLEDEDRGWFADYQIAHRQGQLAYHEGQDIGHNPEGYDPKNKGLWDAWRLGYTDAQLNAMRKAYEGGN